MNVSDWIDPSFSYRLVTALMHFLWQGSLVALLAAIGDALLSRASASRRYALHVTALLIMVGCVWVTFSFIEPPALNPVLSTELTTITPDTELNASQFDDVDSSEMPTSVAPAIVDVERSVADVPAIVERVEPPKVSQELLINDVDQWQQLQRWAPLIALLYFAGSGLLLARLIRGTWVAHRLRRMATIVTDDALITALQRQSTELGLRVLPQIAWCAEVSIPLVIGVLKPMILLPAAAATGLSSDQLHALITHELAHIRRYDLFVNLVQRIIESLLFFHPTVWFISRRISSEREQACDELVLATGCERLQYADALVRMAELSSLLRCTNYSTPATSLAASGANSSEFKRRVLKVLSVPTSSQLRPSRIALLFFVTLVVGMAVTASRLPFNVFAQSPVSEGDSDDIDNKDNDSTRSQALPGNASSEAPPQVPSDAATQTGDAGTTQTKTEHEAEPPQARSQAEPGNEKHRPPLPATELRPDRKHMPKLADFEALAVMETRAATLSWEQLLERLKLEEAKYSQLELDAETHQFAGGSGVRPQDAFGVTRLIRAGEQSYFFKLIAFADYQFQTEEVVDRRWLIRRLSYPLDEKRQSTQSVSAIPVNQHRFGPHQWLSPSANEIPVSFSSFLSTGGFSCVSDERLGPDWCLKIAGKQNALWLALDKNLVPIRYEVRLEGDARPARLVCIDRIDEIKPGLWFPRRIIGMRNVQLANGVDFKTELGPTTLITRVSLEPRLEVGLFEKLGKHPDGEPPVFAPQNEAKSFVAMMGEVKTPQTYEFLQPPAVQSLIDSAGGWQPSSSRTVRVVRLRQKRDLVEIPLSDPDNFEDVLRSGDVVIVEPNAAAREKLAESTELEVALIGVLDYPIVRRLDRQKATLNEIARHLHQAPQLASTALVWTPLRSATQVKVDEPLPNHSVIRFDRSMIDTETLPKNLPSPFVANSEVPQRATYNALLKDVPSLFQQKESRPGTLPARSQTPPGNEETVERP